MIHSKFEAEADLVRSKLEPDEILEVKLVEENETNLNILVIVTPDEYIQLYVRPLSRAGYTLIPERSTIINLFFKKERPLSTI